MLEGIRGALRNPIATTVAGAISYIGPIASLANRIMHPFSAEAGRITDSNNHQADPLAGSVGTPPNDKQNASIQTDIGSQQLSKLEYMQQTFPQLQAQNNELQTQNSGLQAQNDGLQTQNNGLQAQNNRLNQVAENCRAENEAQRIQLDGLQKKCANLKADLTERTNMCHALQLQATTITDGINREYKAGGFIGALHKVLKDNRDSLLNITHKLDTISGFLFAKLNDLAAKKYIPWNTAKYISNISYALPIVFFFTHKLIPTYHPLSVDDTRESMKQWAGNTVVKSAISQLINYTLEHVKTYIIKFAAHKFALPELPTYYTCYKLISSFKHSEANHKGYTIPGIARPLAILASTIDIANQKLVTNQTTSHILKDVAFAASIISTLIYNYNFCLNYFSHFQDTSRFLDLIFKFLVVQCIAVSIIDFWIKGCDWWLGKKSSALLAAPHGAYISTLLPDALTNFIQDAVSPCHHKVKEYLDKCAETYLIQDNTVSPFREICTCIGINLDTLQDTIDTLQNTVYMLQSAAMSTFNACIDKCIEAVHWPYSAPSTDMVDQ